MLLPLAFQHYGSQNVAPAMHARFECSRDTDHPDPIIPNYVAHSHQDQLNRRSTSSSQQGPSTRSCSLCSRTGQGPREESGRCSRTSYRCRGEYALVFISFPYPADSISQLIYTASVGVGAGTYSLIVDTGSSNTWVGADSNNPYKPGPNSLDTGSTVSVSYGSGNFSGKECGCLSLISSNLDNVSLIVLALVTDDVKLGSATITGQSIGVAKQSTGFNGMCSYIFQKPTC